MNKKYRTRSRYLLLGITLLAVSACLYHAGSLTVDPAHIQAAAAHDRLIVVLAEKTDAQVWAYEKKKGTWAEYLHAKGFVGHNGVTAAKREGDGCTPAGLYRMRRAFGCAQDPGSLLPYHHLESDDYWVDDPASRYYNIMVKGEVADRDWHSAEHLATERIAYKYAVVIEYNTDPIVPGAGSAILLHCSQGKPTTGCVSVPEEVMIRLLRFIRPGDGIIIARSMEELTALQE